MDLILEAINLAEDVVLPELSVNRQQVEVSELLLAQLQRVSESLFPIEEVAKHLLRNKIVETKRQIEQLDKEKEYVANLEPFASRYKRLSLDPLRWRDKQGFPRLAIFSVYEPIFTIAVWPQKERRLSPSFPSRIKDCFNDVFRLLEKQRSSRKGLSISCQFDGLIPDNVREKIVEATQDALFAKQVYIISEPSAWVLNEIRPIPNKDPLVVGYTDLCPDHLWLIDSFDVTPIEQAMISFTEMVNYTPAGQPH